MLAGIDVGTTGCKCSVYSREGILKREAYEEYPAGQEKTVEENWTLHLYGAA